MDAARLLDTLTAAGVELIPAPPMLRVRPLSKLPPDGARLIREHKAELLALLTAPDLYGFTMRDLKLEADPAEWLEIQASPEALQQFAMALMESRQIAAGIRPERWTATATCARCGPVYVAPFLEGQRLAGCRWCAPRRAGVLIPRPEEDAA